ncbi:MAG: hypothetical protein AAB961_00610, partial [Patescibacteria group bacterium]
YELRPFLTLEWGSFMSLGSRVPNDWILSAAETVLANIKTYQKAISKFFSDKSIYNGAQKAASLIENI